MLKTIINKGFRLSFSKTAKSLYWVFSGNIFTIILAFFTTIIIARFLNKDAFGIYLAIYSFSSLFADLADIGFGPSLTNFLPPLIINKDHYQIKKILSSAFYLESFIAITFMIIIVLFSNFIAVRVFNGIDKIYVLLSGLMLYAILLFNFINLAFTAYKKFKEIALLNIIVAFIRLVLVIISAYIFHLSLFWILFIYIITFVLGWFLSFIYLKPVYLKLNLSSETAKKIFNFSGPMGIQKICVAISSRLDLLMLVSLSGAMEAGIYGAALRVAQVLPFFISSYSMVVAPRFAEYSKGNFALNFFKKTLFLMLLFLGGLVIFYFLSDLIIQILFPKYIESTQILKMLLLSMTGFILASPFVSLLTYTFRKPVIIAMASIAQLLVIVISNFIFIPKYGRFGPIVGLTLGNMLMFIITAIATVILFKNERKYENRN